MHPDAFKTILGFCGAHVLKRFCNSCWFVLIATEAGWRCLHGASAPATPWYGAWCWLGISFSLEDLESVNTPLCRAWDLAVSCRNWCQPGLLWHIGCLKLSIPSENVIIHPEQKIGHRLYVLSKDVKCTVYLNTAVGQSTTAHVIFVYSMLCLMIYY